MFRDPEKAYDRVAIEALRSVLGVSGLLLKEIQASYREGVLV